MDRSLALLRRRLCTAGSIVPPKRLTAHADWSSDGGRSLSQIGQADLNRSSSSLLALEPTTLNTYAVTIPPNHDQLRYANSFFSAVPPTLLYTAAYLRDLPASPFPEVAFLGRSNVGKSSLLNALFGRSRARDARVSKHPGMTKTMNGFGVAGPQNPLRPVSKNPKGQQEPIWKRFPRHGGLVVMDMPGYGMGSREEWGREILRYLGSRKQLRRTYVLVDTEHGLKSTDVEIVKHLRSNGLAFQIVLSKADKLLHPDPKLPGPIRLSNRLKELNTIKEKVREQLNEMTGDGRDGVGDILCCSGLKSLTASPQKLGINELRWAVLNACGLESDIFGTKRKRLVPENYTITSPSKQSQLDVS